MIKNYRFEKDQEADKNFKKEFKRLKKIKFKRFENDQEL